jgi:hypothetical protein
MREAFDAIHLCFEHDYPPLAVHHHIEFGPRTNYVTPFRKKREQIDPP